MIVYPQGATVEVLNRGQAASPSTSGGHLRVYTQGDTVEVLDRVVTPAPPTIAAPQVLRTIQLSDVGPKVTSVSPNMGENGTYNRVDQLIFWESVATRTWSWQFGQGEIPAPLPRMRMLIDGTPVTDWQGATDVVKGKYNFSFTTPNGHHLCHVEAEGLPVQCMAVPFHVNDTGLPLVDFAPWTAVNRFEKTYGNLSNCAVQIRYGEAAPAIRPLKVRTPEPFNVLLDKSELTVTHFARNIGAALMREWALAPDGTITIEKAQKYFHANAITKPEATGWVPPDTAVKDGPRGVGTFGYMCDAIIRSSNIGVYFTETNGAFRHTNPQGRVVTIFGRRLKAGIKPHSGVKTSLYMYPGKHDAWYASFWEFVGDASRLTGPKDLWEPWGGCFLSRRADGTLNLRDGHEIVLADTRNNRLIYANHYTAHSLAGYKLAEFGPVGYVPPDAPTGKTQLVDFVNPGPACKEPWKVRINPVDSRYYWTNFAGNSIARCNLDGTGVELVFESDTHPTDLQLGIPKRLSWGAPALNIRMTWLRDGVQGQASLTRPTGFDFDEHGNIVVAEHYTYAIRKIMLFDAQGAELAPAARTIKTLATILDSNRGSDSSGNKEPALVIDRDGVNGPAGDIFVSCWAGNTDYRYDKAGVKRGKSGRGANTSWAQWMFQSGKKLLNGPMNLCDGPGYSWGFDVWGGVMFVIGNAAGNQSWWVTKRKADDPVIDEARWARGKAAVAGIPTLVMGYGGQGNLGLPTAEGMMTATDAEFESYLAGLGVSASSLSDAVYFYRSNVADHEVV